MQCPNCGNVVSDEEIECPECGASLAAPAEEAAEGEAFAAEEAPVKPRKKRWPIVVAIVIAVVVIAVAAIVAFVMYQNNLKEQQLADSQAVYAEEHATTAVHIKAQMDDYVYDGGSGFPVNISGTDLDGNAVSGHVVVNSADYTTDLKRGQYVFEPVGDAISADGTVYTVTAASYSVVVNAMGVEVGTSAFPSVRPQFAKVEADQVTDEQLEAIASWMRATGTSSTTVDKLIEVAKQKREERITELARIEAERVAAREQAIMEAATDFINCVYDNSTSDLSTSRNRPHNLTYHYSPQVTPSSIEWLNTSLTSLDYMRTVDENTVEVSLSYRYGTKDNVKLYRVALTLAFDEDCKIISGAPGLSGYTAPADTSSNSSSSSSGSSSSNSANTRTN